MKKFLVCAALATVAPTLHAAMMNYSAFISCSNCVTVSLSWANENIPYGVSYAEVDDNLGNFLFALQVPAPPVSTGAIAPDPQTVSGLSPTTIGLITNGLAGVPPLIPSSQDGTPMSANLNLLTSGKHVIDSQVFVATVPAGVPEPAGWSLTCAGMALLLLWTQRRRRNSQT